jgi:hypothetical protein
MKARIEELERRKAELTAHDAGSQRHARRAPNMANIYRAKIATLTEVLNDPGGGATAAGSAP